MRTVARTAVTIVLAGTLSLGALPAAMAADQTTRLSGPDRISTAISASREPFGDTTTKNVILSSAASYADAIGGGTLATALKGPLLLTDPTSLRADVAAEIDSVLAGGGKVTVLGGAKAISPAVVQALEARGHRVERLAGADRFETAVEIAIAAGNVDSYYPDENRVFLVDGTNFPDGLAASPLASSEGGVVLLTDGESLSSPTQLYISYGHEGTDEVVTTSIGGPASRAYPSEREFVGRDRYETAALVAAGFPPGGGVLGLSTGENWPDALIGSATMGRSDGPLLLTNGKELGIAGSVTKSLRQNNNGRPLVGVVFGGTKAVSPVVEREWADLL